jgi:short-subunit dehydrogenase
VRSFHETYGPWAVVAGASDGIGAAFARQLADRGVNIVLVARRRAALDHVAAGLAVETRTVVLDLAGDEATADLATATDDLAVGLLVYNAGADPHSTLVLDTPVADLRSLVRRNCNTVVASCHHFGRRLVEQGHGGVVLVTSGAAWAGARHVATYAATKAFDLVLAEGLWAEWRDRGVDVLALVLGATDTPSLHRLLERHGGDFGPLADPDAVVAEALEHLGDGPTWSYGMPDPGGASPLASLPRRDAVLLMSRGSAAVFADGGAR